MCKCTNCSLSKKQVSNCGCFSTGASSTLAMLAGGAEIGFHFLLKGDVINMDNIFATFSEGNGGLIAGSVVAGLGALAGTIAVFKNCYCGCFHGSSYTRMRDRDVEMDRARRVFGS